MYFHCAIKNLICLKIKRIDISGSHWAAILAPYKILEGNVLMVYKNRYYVISIVHFQEILATVNIVKIII